MPGSPDEIVASDSDSEAAADAVELSDVELSDLDEDVVVKTSAAAGKKPSRAASGRLSKSAAASSSAAAPAAKTLREHRRPGLRSTAETLKRKAPENSRAPLISPELAALAGKIGTLGKRMRMTQEAESLNQKLTEGIESLDQQAQQKKQEEAQQLKEDRDAHDLDDVFGEASIRLFTGPVRWIGAPSKQLRLPSDSELSDLSDEDSDDALLAAYPPQLPQVTPASSSSSSSASASAAATPRRQDLRRLRYLGGLSCRLQADALQLQTEELRQKVIALDQALWLLPQPSAVRQLTDWMCGLQPDRLAQSHARQPGIFADHCRVLLELVALCPVSAVLRRAAVTLEKLLLFAAGSIAVSDSALGHDQFAFRSPARESLSSFLPPLPHDQAWVPGTAELRRYLRCYGADFRSAASSSSRIVLNGSQPSVLEARAGSLLSSAAAVESDGFPIVNFVYLCRMVKLFADCFPDLYLERAGERRGVLALLLRACVDPVVQEARMPVMDAVTALLRCTPGLVEIVVRLQEQIEGDGSALQKPPGKAKSSSSSSSSQQREFDELKSSGGGEGAATKGPNSMFDSPVRGSGGRSSSSSNNSSFNNSQGSPLRRTGSTGSTGSPMRKSPGRGSRGGASQSAAEAQRSSILNYFVPLSRLPSSSSSSSSSTASSSSSAVYSSQPSSTSTLGSLSQPNQSSGSQPTLSQSSAAPSAGATPDSAPTATSPLLDPVELLVQDVSLFAGSDAALPLALFAPPEGIRRLQPNALTAGASSSASSAAANSIGLRTSVAIRLLQSLPYTAAGQPPLSEPANNKQGEPPLVKPETGKDGSPRHAELVAAQGTHGVTAWTEGVRQWASWFLLRSYLRSSQAEAEASSVAASAAAAMDDDVEMTDDEELGLLPLPSSSSSSSSSSSPSSSSSSSSKSSSNSILSQPDPEDDLRTLRSLLRDKVVIAPAPAADPRAALSSPGSNSTPGRQLRVRVPRLSSVLGLLDEYPLVAERLKQPVRHARWLLRLVGLLELVTGDLRLVPDLPEEAEARRRLLKMFPAIHSLIPLRQQAVEVGKLQSLVNAVTTKWEILGLSSHRDGGGVDVLTTWEDLRLRA